MDIKLNVTILILIDGFLQLVIIVIIVVVSVCHNPYFNRWFSAILNVTAITSTTKSHNPYFNRWFSAMHSRRYKRCS